MSNVFKIINSETLPAALFWHCGHCAHSNKVGIVQEMMKDFGGVLYKICPHCGVQSEVTLKGNDEAGWVVWSREVNNA